MLILNGPNDIPGYRCLGRTISIHYTTCAKTIHVLSVLLLSSSPMSERVFAETPQTGMFLRWPTASLL